MAQCITPLTLKQTNDDGSSITVPCGRCPACKRRRIAGWTQRLLQEDRRCYSAYFLTLTYDTKHVPLTKNGFMSLNKHDVQCFIKLLRKRQPETKIIYYLAGEYGGRTKRPHYHLIIFNILKDYYISECWTKGSFYVDKVTGASIAYSLKYMDKPSLIPQHRNDDRLPEFSLMSKKIGQTYISDRNIDWHNDDLFNRMYVSIGNYKISMPRYYKSKIYTESDLANAGYAAYKAALQKANLEMQLRLVTRSPFQIEHERVQSDIQVFRKFNNNLKKEKS